MAKSFVNQWSRVRVVYFTCVMIVFGGKIGLSVVLRPPFFNDLRRKCLLCRNLHLLSHISKRLRRLLPGPARRNGAIRALLRQKKALHGKIVVINLWLLTLNS